MGTGQSVSNLAYIPGPLLGGLFFEVGLSAPFYLSAIILIIAFGLGYWVFHRYTLDVKRKKH